MSSPTNRVLRLALATALVAPLAAVGLAGPVEAVAKFPCQVFPRNNVWNTRVDTLPVHPRSADYVAAIGANAPVHPDFGAGTWNGGPIGIPYVVVSGTQRKVRVDFEVADESDRGRYPIPRTAPIEGGSASSGDRHVLVIDKARCKLYELYSAYPQADRTWDAYSGAVFDLRRNQLRPAGWTSSDAAGLPVFAGLVRYDEVARGEIRHALRFTAPVTQRAYLWPARHYASRRTETNLPPMGLRMRLKADFDISGFPRHAQVILTAMKRYGIILADNGSPWFVTGAPDKRWNDSALRTLRQVPGSAFEAVDASVMMVDPNSATAKLP